MIGARRNCARSSRGNHAAATMSSCWPTMTVSPGRVTVSATRSLRSGAGAVAMRPRASGLSRAATPAAALSTVTAMGSVATVCPPCRARTGPMTRSPARSARSRSSRIVVRNGPPAPSTTTSVTSRDPTMANPVSDGRTMPTGSAERVRARTVSVNSSPDARRRRSTLARTSGVGGRGERGEAGCVEGLGDACSASTSQSAPLTSL